MKQLDVETPRRVPWALAATVTIALSVAMVYLQLAIYPSRVVPLTYSLLLLLGLWHRNKALLWGIVACFMVISASKVLWLIPDAYFDDTFQQYLFIAMQWLNIIVPAAVVHVMLLYRSRLLKINEAIGATNVELEVRNEELAASNEKLAAREEEISRQNEELQSQTEELEQQAEELQSLNEELSGREAMLQMLVQLSGPATGESQLLDELCAAGPKLLGEDVAAVAVLERCGDELIVRAHSEFGSEIAGERLPLEATLAALALERGQLAQLEDTRLRPDLRFPKSSSGIMPASVLSAPLCIKGQPVGALEAYATQSRPWTPQQAQLVEWLAGQCSRAWENARLHEESKRAEVTLRQSAQFPEENPNPVLRIAADGELLYANLPAQAWLADIGATAERPLPGILPAITADAYQQGQQVQTEIADRTGRTFWISAIRPHGEEYVNVYGRNVTERKAAEESLRRTADELARSNKDLEQFAYVASHDLQEPLRMVAGYLQLLSERYRGRLDEKADTFIAYAVEGAERMSRLIRDLLDYSRVNARGKELCPTNAEEALTLALRNLQAATEESNAAITHDPLPTVWADKSRLAQLFQNLVGNAIKFRSPDRPARIHISAERKNEHWVFSVRDNGIGFDQQYQDKMFMIFQRLHSRGKYPGTGIGLALCKRIVERHGGTIWASGTPDEGATFYFTMLPQSEG